MTFSQKISHDLSEKKIGKEKCVCISRANALSSYVIASFQSKSITSMSMRWYNSVLVSILSPHKSFMWFSPIFIISSSQPPFFFLYHMLKKEYFSQWRIKCDNRTCEWWKKQRTFIATMCMTNVLSSYSQKDFYNRWPCLMSFFLISLLLPFKIITNRK
jgi:hypothetical protein